MLTTIGLGRRIDSPTVTTSPFEQPPVVIQSQKHAKRTSSASTVDDSEQSAESVHTTARSRPCSSPVRPNSLILSSSQKCEHVTDDDNEKYYSAQSSKISTPMVHSIVYRKDSEERLHLSSIVDLDSEEQKNHHTKVLQPEVKARNCAQLLEKEFLL